MSAPSSSLSSLSASASASSSTSVSASSSTTTSHFDLFPTGTSSTIAHSTSSGIVLFPTPTGSAAAAPGSSAGNPNVYYLVLLGIVVVMAIFAGLLMLRGHRMRRRYRTATQLAIARGQPVRWWRDDRDDLGLHAVFRNGPPPGPPEDWVNVGSRKRHRRWMRIPVLWTAEVEDGSREDVEHLLRLERSASSSSVDKELSEKREWYDNGTEAADAGVDGWGGVQPLTVHSLVPDSTPVPATPAPMPVLPPPPTTVLGLLRYGFTTVPQPEREAAPPPTPREREIDRATERRLDDAEPVRVSFMIQMPVLPEEVARERMRRERERDVDEEEAGWRAGMEIGVWEGTVDAADTHASYPPPPQLLPLGERSV